MVLLGGLRSTWGACYLDQGVPQWTDPESGPKVDQPNTTDPTKTVVSWRDMVNNPDCADAIRIWVWRKDFDAMQKGQVRVGFT